MARRPTLSYEEYLRAETTGGPGAQPFRNPDQVERGRTHAGKAMGPYLQTLAMARAIQWGKSYNWDMRIPSAPNPFQQWFPAIEADRNIGSVLSQDVQIGSQGFKLPSGKTQNEIRLTFHDDEGANLERWLDEWINGTGQPGTGLVDVNGAVATLSEAVKDFHFVQLNNKREVVSSIIMWVYPDGSYNSVRDSQSNMLTHVCTFSIAHREVQHATNFPS